MEEDNNIKKYSAVDFEKYWKGELSRAEMNALEKAALDDPFLADALEGYRNISTAGTDITLLKQKLNERIAEPGKSVIKGIHRLTWLRAAAVVIIIGGIAVFASQYVLNKKENLAMRSGQSETDNLLENKSSESQQAIILTDTIKNAGAAARQQTGLKTDTLTFKISDLASDSASAAGNLTFIIPTAVAANQDSKVQSAAPGSVKEGKEKITSRAKDKNTDDEIQSNKLSDLDNLKQKRSLAEPRFSKKEQGFIALNNSFNGLVVDAQNNPVPFANVTNTRDQVGTYTDIRGKFNLVSSDSILDVQIKSLGYETRNYRLLPAGKDTSLILQEDLLARSGILNSGNRKVVTNRAREENRVLEEPEPEIGWNNYDTYIANNINIPDDIRNRNTGGEVELSFQIDKNGEPTKIRVIRSSQCRECDEEAIRVLKEGPKWKRRGKNYKTTVTITVNR